MTFRYCVVVLLAAGLMFVPVRKATAVGLPPVVPVPIVTTSSSVGAVAWAAGGIIGVAAVLCIYDIWLKANGFKNWDGSPIVVHHQRHR